MNINNNQLIQFYLQKCLALDGLAAHCEVLERENTVLKAQLAELQAKPDEDTTPEEEA